MAIKTNTTDFRVTGNINVNEINELQYWSEKYNVSVDKIREIVNAVGPVVKHVETRLRKKN
jgi:hypothetical protein